MSRLTRPTLRRNRSVSTASQGPLGATTKSTVDHWLVRIANGSQVALVALAVFGYFYTVLPVYQKSLLDEEIAKKTLELNRKDADIAARVDELRDKDRELGKKQQELELRSAEIETIKATASQLKVALTQKQGEVGALRSNLSEQYSELRVRLLQEFQQLGARYCSFPSLKGESFSSCLISKVLPATGLARWTREDQALMRSQILQQQSSAERAWSEYFSSRRAAQERIQALGVEADNECAEMKRTPEYANEARRRSIDSDCASRALRASSEALQISIQNFVNPESVTREQLFAIAKRFSTASTLPRSTP